MRHGATISSPQTAAEWLSIWCVGVRGRRSRRADDRRGPVGIGAHGAQASAIVARRDVGAIVDPPTVRVRITHDPHRRRRTRHRTVAGSLRSPRLNTAERRPRDSTPFMRVSPSCRSRGGNGGWRGPDPSFAGTVVGEPVTSWTSLPRAGPRNTGSVSACGKPEAIQVAATRRTSVALPALQSPRRVRFPPAGVPKSVAGSATVAASSRSSARA